VFINKKSSAVANVSPALACSLNSTNRKENTVTRVSSKNNIQLCLSKVRRIRFA
jgi:hypothetical protein